MKEGHSSRSQEPASDDSPRFLSLFSGAGGMDVGFESAGFLSVGDVEIESHAQATLKANRPDRPLLAGGDVLAAADTLAPVDLGLEVGELDLIAGGPPCQPFSVAAQWHRGGRLGMADERAKTVHAALDLFGKFLPKALVFENVPGFVNGATSALPEIQKRLGRVAKESGLEYKIHWSTLNAADYGVPQNRKRMIIVILRDDLEWAWPERTHADAPVSAWDAIGDLVKDRDAPLPQGGWAALLPSIPEGENYNWLSSKGGGEELFGYRTKYWNFLLKLAKDRPSWTLVASPGPSTGPFHWSNRPLSIREAMRIQSFPDSWVFDGSYRDQMKLIGNATPPLLAQAIGRQLRLSLGLPQASTMMEPLPKRARMPRPVKPIPVPEQYRHLIGSKDAHGGTGKGPSPREEAAT